MAKATKTVPQEMLIANPQGKTVKELKEVAVTLQAQANQHRDMTMKAQGALEVILQMIPKEEVEEMIAQENKDNGEMVNDTETAA
jgi:hypothetical protein